MRVTRVPAHVLIYDVRKHEVVLITAAHPSTTEFIQRFTGSLSPSLVTATVLFDSLQQFLETMT